VPPDARARVERLEPERLGPGGLDHVPQVDAQLVAEPGHLVDQRDVDVPVGVLQQLGRLCLAGALGAHHRVDEPAVELGGGVTAALRVEVVPGLVEIEVAVPRLTPALG